VVPLVHDGKSKNREAPVLNITSTGKCSCKKITRKECGFLVLPDFGMPGTGSDTVYDNVIWGCGALIAISQSVFGVKRRFNLELKLVWMEIKINYGFILVTGDHYFPPDIKVDILQSYFNHLDTQNFHMALIGGFNVPNFDWEHGLSVSNCHYCSKQKGDMLYTSTCVLGLCLHNKAEVGRNLLDLVSSDFDGLDIKNAEFGMMTPGYHLPLVIDVFLPTCQLL
jgi:hypothetical protein